MNEEESEGAGGTKYAINSPAGKPTFPPSFRSC